MSIFASDCVHVHVSTCNMPRPRSCEKLFDMIQRLLNRTIDWTRESLYILYKYLYSLYIYHMHIKYSTGLMTQNVYPSRLHGTNTSAWPSYVIPSVSCAPLASLALHYCHLHVAYYHRLSIVYSMCQSIHQIVIYSLVNPSVYPTLYLPLHQWHVFYPFIYPYLHLPFQTQRWSPRTRHTTANGCEEPSMFQGIRLWRVFLGAAAC